MRWIILTALLFVVTGMLGCSSGSRVGVEGKVTYAGEPLHFASITFLPTDEKGIKAGGFIANGAYKVESRFGPNPGPHRVEIRWAKPTGKKYKNEFGEELDVRREGLPDKYHTNSILTADIKSGNNVIDFNLEK
jgi:hypothetical protein